MSDDRRCLPTLAEVQALRRAVSKGAITPVKASKGKRDRAEGKVKTSVRAACVVRDGYCRVEAMNMMLAPGDEMVGNLDPCDGPSEWAHMGEKQRSKTRGQAPEVRHTTAGSLLLCQKHHGQYDGRVRPRLSIKALSNRGADGPLRFTTSEDTWAPK